jgi:hypothetical protein
MLLWRTDIDENDNPQIESNEMASFRRKIIQIAGARSFFNIIMRWLYLLIACEKLTLKDAETQEYCSKQQKYYEMCSRKKVNSRSVG